MNAMKLQAPHITILRAISEGNAHIDDIIEAAGMHVRVADAHLNTLRDNNEISYDINIGYQLTRQGKDSMRIIAARAEILSAEIPMDVLVSVVRDVIQMMYEDGGVSKENLRGELINRIAGC